MTQIELANNIKRIAKEHGIGLFAIAERSGFSKQQFSDMLHGRKIIRAEYMPSIAAAIGVGVGQLYKQ